MTTEKDSRVNVLKPGRVDGHNSKHRSGISQTGRVYKRIHNEIEELLQQNKDLAAHKEKKVGQGTQDKRSSVINGFFSDLFLLGYKLESIHNLKEKHLLAVFRNYVAVAIT